MTNLTPVSSFDDVPQLETTTLALGGAGGPMNLPAQALLNRTQWLRDNALAGSSGPYAVGSGLANAQTAAFSPAITALADGMKLRFKAEAANTGAATFAPDAIAAKPILGSAMLPLQGGELVVGGEVELVWNAAADSWVLLANTGNRQVPDAAASHHAVSLGQMDSALSVTVDLSTLASTDEGMGASLVGVQDLNGYFGSSLLEDVLAELAVYLPNGTGALSQRIRDELRRVVRPEHYGALGNGVADDTAAIDKAVQAAAGGILRFTPGKTYMLSTVLYGTGTALRIPSNITIIAHGATIKRGSAAVELMLSNNSNGTVGGYGANSDIRIYGGTWDPNYPGIAGPSMPMGFVHSTRIQIRDAYMFSGFGSHHIELNACSDVVVSGCTFEGGAEQADETMEAVQIDGAISSAQWAVGPFDNTFCSNIKVIGNTFKNCGSGVGSHSSVSGFKHSSINVSQNSFSQMYFCGVRVTNWENSIISNNIFYGGLHAVKVISASTTIISGITIANNEISHAGLTADGTAGSGHAIYLLGNSALTQQVQQFVIRGNVIRDTTDAKSGCGIKIDYCGQGLVEGNVVVNSTTDGINIFGSATNGGMIVSGNRVSGSSNIDINVSTVTAVSILANQCATLKYTSLLKGLIMHNNVFNSAGITSGGTNTNTTVKDNLQNTTFA